VVVLGLLVHGSGAFAVQGCGKGQPGLLRSPVLQTSRRCGSLGAAGSPEGSPVARRVQDLSGERVVQIADVTPGPGLRNTHLLHVTESGKRFLAKVNTEPGALANLEAERDGLEALSEAASLCASGLVVPKPLSVGCLSGDGGFLILEHMDLVPFGPSIPSVAGGLGRGLAMLHKASQDSGFSAAAPLGECYGYHMDNFLGGGDQGNGWSSSLADFFVERRLKPLLDATSHEFSRSAESNGTPLQGATAIDLDSYLDNVLQQAWKVLKKVEDREAPALMHGDLWAGNAGALRTAARGPRTPVLLDPAVWMGPPEFDLALSSLYGRFRDEFHEEYHAILPKTPGFQERQEVYRLYHILNHLRLHGPGFGYQGDKPRGYLEQAVESMSRILGQPLPQRHPTSAQSSIEQPPEFSQHPPSSIDPWRNTSGGRKPPPFNFT